MLDLFEDKPGSLDDIRAQWAGCDKCYFSARWKDTGPCLPRGPARGREVLVLGQWPGEQDMALGSPYTGPQGIKTRRMVTEAGFREDYVFYDNVLMCSCPMEPSKTILNNCAPHVDQVLDVVRPLLIIAMGNLAAKRMKVKGGLTGNRGKLHRYRSYHVAPCIHTAAIDRQKSSEEKAELEMEVRNDLDFAFSAYQALKRRT